LCLIGIYGVAQKPGNRVVIGTVDSVYSKILNEKRALLIHVPNGSNDERYPVLYILDGEDHFNSAAGIVQQMAGVIPDMIVVGITNTVRQRDLTPTQVNGDKVSGGGENFIKFINNELYEVCRRTLSKRALSHI
jgi:predicted alpha/beta superfamily hydrolase